MRWGNVGGIDQKFGRLERVSFKGYLLGLYEIDLELEALCLLPKEFKYYNFFFTLARSTVLADDGDREDLQTFVPKSILDKHCTPELQIIYSLEVSPPPLLNDPQLTNTATSYPLATQSVPA